jgi:hypothetical protein
VSKETKARASEELWHLGIGDLLALPEKPTPTALCGPFVINLRTSSTPIGGVSNALRRFEHLHVYRLERRHEGRPQFLLRVGIIETELEADAILMAVREEYPGAFKASAGGDDRKAVAATARVATARRATQRSGPRRSEASMTPLSSPPTPKSVAVDPQPPFRWNIDEVLPDLATRLPSMPPAPPAVASLRSSGSSRGESRTPGAKVAPLEQAPAPPAPTDAGKPQSPIAPPAAPPPPIATVPPPPIATTLQPSVATAPQPSVATAPQPSVATAPQPSVATAPQPSVATTPQAPAAEAATSWIDEELDCDPNAVTDQVEALLFTFDRSFEAEASQPPVVQAADAPLVETVSESPDCETADVGPMAVEINITQPVEPQPGFLSCVDSDGEVAIVAEPPEPLESLEQLESVANEPAPPAVSIEVADPSSSAAGLTLELPTESRPAEGPQIDRTQTVRALTRLELEDGQSSPWFAIQLVLSEEEIDPHEVPNLSIFAEYRLYAVTGLHQDRCMHALRLGFFSSETAAAAVAGYLASCFDAPTIKRVSVAEHERFEEQRLTARKDVGGGDGHVVIELAAPAPSLLRQAREKLQFQRKHDKPDAGSIWSRLLPSRKS